jgi:hypothetical protein
MTITFKAGLYDSEPNFPPDSPPRLHQSTAKVLLMQSPLHAWHRLFGPQEPQEPEEFNNARNFGTLCHELLLGGKNIVVVEAPDWRTNAAREARDMALAAGKIPVLRRRSEEAGKLVNRVVTALEHRGLSLENARSEVTAVWKSSSGAWCEGRIDHLILPKPRARKTSRALILDFKFTTVEAVKKACESRFIEYGYDIQHAAYVEAVETIFPKLRGRVEMIFFFVEVEPPHAIRTMPLAASMKNSGLWRWNKARGLWRECLRKYGTETPWPSYGDDGEPAECPQWELNRQIEEARMEENAS